MRKPRPPVLTRKERKKLAQSLKKLRAELADQYDSQGVDCCQHLLNLLQEGKERKA